MDGFEMLDRFHRELIERLDELIALVADLRNFRTNADTESRARTLIAYFSTTARQHNEDEERHVFPAMQAAADNELKEVLLRLQEDHAWIELYWLDIEPHLRAVAAGTCSYDIEELQEGIEVLTALWREHLTLEEAVLYPQAQNRIPLAERESMRREMVARRRRELRRGPARAQAMGRE